MEQAQGVLWEVAAISGLQLVMQVGRPAAVRWGGRVPLLSYHAGVAVGRELRPSGPSARREVVT